MGVDSRLPIPTTRGWLPAAMIKAGDEVFTYQGKPTRVTLTQQYQPQECYKIWLKDGLTLVVDNKTGIPAYTKMTMKSLRAWDKHRSHPRRGAKVTPQGAQRIMNFEAGKCRVPVAQPIKPVALPLIVDPYTFGAWIMTSKSVRERQTEITRELVERFGKIPESIPEEYLMASFEQRVALLRGILSKRPRAFNLERTQFGIGTNDVTLARQIQNLVESLSSRTSIRYNKRHGTYRVMFRSFLNLVPGQTPPKNSLEMEYRQITKVAPAEPRECTYIKTEDPDNTFVVSEGFLIVSL
jgi:hypothetical protein